MPFNFVWIFVVVCFNLSVFLPTLIYAFTLSSYHKGVSYSVFTSVFDFYIQFFKSWTLFSGSRCKVNSLPMEYMRDPQKLVDFRETPPLLPTRQACMLVLW